MSDTKTDLQNQLKKEESKLPGLQAKESKLHSQHTEAKIALDKCVANINILQEQINNLP